MFKTFHNPALRLAIFTFCMTMTSVARAHPEMDRFGRDITSGPPNKMVVNILDNQATSDLVTQSFSKITHCSRQAPSACPIQLAPEKKKWFRGED